MQSRLQIGPMGSDATASELHATWNDLTVFESTIENIYLVPREPAVTRLSDYLGILRVQEPPKTMVLPSV